LWNLQWASGQAEDGKVYHANQYTQESRWDPPSKPQVWDEGAAKRVATPWMLCWTGEGEQFWLNTTTGERDVQGPPAVVVDTRPAFVASDKFAGSREGYAFKQGDQGLGYYLDGTGSGGGAGGGKGEGGEKRKRKKKKKANNKWKKSKVNTYVYVTGLPLDTDEEEVAEVT